MAYYVDPDDLAQDIEVKLLELQKERGYSNDAMSSVPLRRTVGKYMRMTHRQHDKARRTNSQVDITTHAEHEDMLDTRDQRKLNAWCTLVDLPKHILVIGYKRVAGYPLTYTEWNHLRKFRKEYVE